MKKSRARLTITIVSCAIGAVPLIAITSAQAVPIPLSNPGFESPSLPPGPYSYNSGSGAIPGWTDATPANNLGGVQNIGPLGASTEAEFPGPSGGAPEGTQAAWLWADYPGDPNFPSGTFPLSTTITQTTGVAALQGVLYTLTGFYGQPLIGGSSQVPAALSTITLFQGSTPIGIFGGTGPSGSLGPFIVAALGQPGGGSLSVELKTTSNYSYFDTIALESNQAVPEPASLALCGIATVFIAVGRRRRRSIG